MGVVPASCCAKVRGWGVGGGERLAQTTRCCVTGLSPGVVCVACGQTGESSGLSFKQGDADFEFECVLPALSLTCECPWKAVIGQHAWNSRK